MWERDGQRGIVIGPILFLIAIIGVLAAAIAAGAGSFTGSSSKSGAKVLASAIIDYANTVQIGVDRVLTNGCDETEISFENPIVSGYENPNAPFDKSCHVFDLNGGGIVWKVAPPDIFDKAMHDQFVPLSDFGQYLFSSSCGISLGTGTGAVFQYNATGFPCYYAGNAAYQSSSDLFIFAFWLRKDVCTEINKLVGINTMPNQGNAITPGIGSGGSVRFHGSFQRMNGGNGMVRVVDPRGAMQGCVNGSDVPSNAGGYYFSALLSSDSARKQGPASPTSCASPLQAKAG